MNCLPLNLKPRFNSCKPKFLIFIPSLYNSLDFHTMISHSSHSNWNWMQNKRQIHLSVNIGQSQYKSSDNRITNGNVSQARVCPNFPSFSQLIRSTFGRSAMNKNVDSRSFLKLCRSETLQSGSENSRCWVTIRFEMICSENLQARKEPWVGRIFQNSSGIFRVFLKEWSSLQVLGTKVKTREIVKNHINTYVVHNMNQFFFA